jgi:hypothetical protein
MPIVAIEASNLHSGAAAQIICQRQLYGEAPPCAKFDTPFDESQATCARKVITQAVGQAASVYDGENGREGALTFEACRCDGSAHVGFGVCRPHCTIPICDIALDHCGSQSAFATIVCRLDLTWKFTEDEDFESEG